MPLFSSLIDYIVFFSVSVSIYLIGLSKKDDNEIIKMDKIIESIVLISFWVAISYATLKFIHFLWPKFAENTLGGFGVSEFIDVLLVSGTLAMFVAIYNQVRAAEKHLDYFEPSVEVFKKKDRSGISKRSIRVELGKLNSDNETFYDSDGDVSTSIDVLNASQTSAVINNIEFAGSLDSDLRWTSEDGYRNVPIEPNELKTITVIILATKSLLKKESIEIILKGNFGKETVTIPINDD